MHKNSDFRPDRQRALFLTRAIDQATADQLTRETLPLLGQGDGPITLFIDSPGGTTYFAECIYKTLKLPDQDSGSRHRLITVGLNLAASAACDLLTAGDYALVYPHTTLLCHGVRQSADGLSVTRETALDLAKALAGSNEQYALQLATNAISRFIFRFVTLRHLFDAERAKRNEPDRTEPFCFLDVVGAHVSPPLQLILQEALGDTLKNTNIDLRVRTKLAQDPDSSSRDHVAFEALILGCIIEHGVEFSSIMPGWSFQTKGIPQIESNFSTLLSSYDETHQKQISKLTHRWGEFLLLETHKKAYSELADLDKSEWLERFQGRYTLDTDFLAY